MRQLWTVLVIGSLGTAAAGASALLVREPTRAADHLDPPARTDIRFTQNVDLAADIADVFAWTDDQNLIMVYTFAGPNNKNAPAVYDPNVRYRFHVSYAGRDDDDEILITSQFGPGT